MEVFKLRFFKLRFVPLLPILAALAACPAVALAQAEPSHEARIYGVVQTAEQSVANIFDRNTTVVVRALHNSRMGPIVGISKVSNGHYSVDMSGRPAGQYLVAIDTGGDSLYLPGESVVKFPGGSASVRQNWTLSTYESAVPHRE
jgi:hypothetical protein